MSSNPWSAAFKRAIEVEEEGAKDFVEILAQHAQKKLRPNPVTGDALALNTAKSGAEVQKDDVEGESDSEAAGSSGDLSKLSKFVIETTTPTTTGNQQTHTSTVVAEEQSAAVESKIELVKERDMVEVCGRQMCRAWLKHHYLKIGSACKDGDACLRKHAVTCKPELLYKDYSFKGLSPKQRKSIMEQIKAENAVN